MNRPRLDTKPEAHTIVGDLEIGHGERLATDVGDKLSYRQRPNPYEHRALTALGSGKAGKPAKCSRKKSAPLSRKIFPAHARSPKIAVPTRMIVAPSSMAISKS